MSPIQTQCECLLCSPSLCALPPRPPFKARVQFAPYFCASAALALPGPPQISLTLRCLPTQTTRERRANPEACELYKRKGEAAYKERVLKFALEYPALLEKAKAKK